MGQFLHAMPAEYRAQSQIALAQGASRQAQAERQAADLLYASQRDNYMAGNRMARQSERQDTEQARVRNRHGGGGFLYTGSVPQAEAATARSFTDAMQQAAYRQAVQDGEKRQQALDLQRQGRIDAKQADHAARYYNLLAEQSSKANVWQLFAPLGVAALGYGLGYQQAGTQGLKRLQGGQAGRAAWNDTWRFMQQEPVARRTGNALWNLLTPFGI